MRNSRIRHFLFLVLAAAANPSPPAPAAAAPCLTHDQAREKYPDSHLYWHTDNHCWDDSRRGRGDYEDPAKAPELATPVDQAAPGVHTTVYFPALEINAWPATVLPMGRTDMSSWPLLLDVDQPTKFDRWRDRVSGAWRSP